MKMLFPYSTPIILNDAIFEEFGNNLDTTQQATRQHAYFIAEKKTSEYLETFLLPITVTGTYQYSSSILLEHAYVTAINVVQFLDTKEYVYWSQTGTANVYQSLRNPEYGIMDLHYVVGNCNCHPWGRMSYPYQVRISYTAGLPTGTANQSDILFGMSMYAGIILNEILGYGNESTGDVGVKQFKNLDYAETRLGLINTTFGNSAKAKFIKEQLSTHKLYRHVGLRQW